MPSYTCEKCNKQFPNKTMLTRHQSKKIPCDKCRDLVCPVCDTEFAKLYNVEKHMLEKHPNHPRSRAVAAASTSQTVQIAETINVVTNNNVHVHITLQMPHNLTSPDIQFLTSLSPAELKKKIDLVPEVATLARLFEAIHLSENSKNHSVILEESSNVGYFYHDKWRKEAADCLLSRCASLSASELTDLDYIFTTGLSKHIADEVSSMCSAVESEQLDTERSENLRAAIKSALTAFTAAHPELLSHVKSAATSKKIIHDTAATFEEWKTGGTRYEAFLQQYRD